MKNYERIKNMTIEEMAKEIKLIANWDKKEKSKADKDPDFYTNWLNTEINVDEKCSQMGSEYCKNECPIGQSTPER